MKLGGNISQPVALDFGVPQSSILGSILFVLYMGDFENVVRNCKLHCYADNSQISLAYKPTTTSTRTSNEMEVYS